MKRCGKVARSGQWLALLLVLVAASVQAAVYTTFPDTIDAESRYVFYSHGLIVEGTDPRPVHPEFGTYDYPAIVQAIAESGEFHLIAQHRPAGTEANAYAQQLAGLVNTLLAAGVPADNITLIGFSRGAQITLMAASALRVAGINTAVMGVCFDGDYAHEPEIILSGHVLSLYETTDVVQSCVDLLVRSDIEGNAKSIKEVAITTGLKHGAFYTPRSEWMEPLQQWLHTLAE